jgi:hypothetical protein
MVVHSDLTRTLAEIIFTSEQQCLNNSIKGVTIGEHIMYGTPAVHTDAKVIKLRIKGQPLMSREDLH